MAVKPLKARKKKKKAAHSRRTLGLANTEASGLLNEAGRIADGRLELRLADAARLARLLPALRLPPLRGPALLQAQASGTAEAMALRLAAEVSDLRLEAQPMADLHSGRWAGPILLRHPGAPRLAELLGAPGTARTATGAVPTPWPESWPMAVSRSRRSA
jgi:hypothetical protein